MRPLRDSIGELRLGHQSVSEYLEQALAECELCEAELADCRRQFAEARRSLRECEKQIAERTGAETDLLSRCSVLKQDLDSKELELAQANDRAAEAQARSAQGGERLEIQIEQNQQLREQVGRLETQREALDNELAQLRGQFAPLAESVTETARLRGEVATSQAEAARLRDQLAAAPSEAVVHEQQAAAQSLQQQLESELDALRHRAAELSETLAEQKRVTAQERQQWSEELRQLRRAVERQSEVLAHRTSQEPAAVEQADQARPPGDPTSGDRVVDSLLAQFETLQKNKLRKVANTSA